MKYILPFPNAIVRILLATIYRNIIYETPDSATYITQVPFFASSYMLAFPLLIFSSAKYSRFKGLAKCT